HGRGESAMRRASRRPFHGRGESTMQRASLINALRRDLRGYLFTIAGIAIGVAGIVALGAMAERIVRFIEGGDRFVLGKISVAGRGMGMGAGFTAGGLGPGGCCEAYREADAYWGRPRKG